jgi:8-oxo-dGTP pyrophosphatase MutT (NUDIX family)
VAEAALRELKEEAGVDAQPADLIFSHVMHRRTAGEVGSRISFFFSLKRWAGDPVNAEPHKCAGLLWADPADLRGPGMPPVIDYIADALAVFRTGEGFSANGW